MTTLTKKEILKALKNLGNSAEEVAKSLKDFEIKGAIRVARNCPIANYLKTIGCQDPIVFDKCQDGVTGEFFATPRACFDFIQDFDSYRFPELIEVEP